MKKLMLLVAVMFALSVAVPASRAYAEDVLSGKVLETMDSAGYTYVQIQEKGNKKTWLAVPQMKVEKGKKMSFQGGMEMKNFKSKSLNRTFDSIIFSPGPAN